MGRRWVPRRMRLSWGQRVDVGINSLLFSGGGGSGLFDADDPVAALAALAIGIVVVIVTVFIVVPILLFGLEFVFVGVLLICGLIGRVVFRRPWEVEARQLDGQGTAETWRVVGWRKSAEMIDEVAARIQAGVALPSASTAGRRTGPPLPTEVRRRARRPSGS